MIKIVFAYRDSDIVSLEVKGHANSAPHGKDLVCAGVSAVMLGLNALTDDDNYDLKQNEGHVLITAKNTVTEHDRIVFSTIEKQLESLASSYPDNVRLERKKKQ